MISVVNVTKRFGDYIAVNNLSFDVNAGDIVGFLGPNGAGKSTTMKMLTGFLRADSGSITVDGLDIDKDPQAIQTKLGYLPEGAPAYSDMTVFQMLHFIADIRGLTGALKRSRLAEVIARVELQHVLDKTIEQLSKGFKRRVGIAQAILHDPEILILDEPTDGLDPNQKHQVRELIRSLSQDKLVIVSTHILEEVAAVCNRALIIAGGRKLFDDTPQALQRRSRYFEAVSMRFAEPLAESSVAELVGGFDFEVGDRHHTVTVFPQEGDAGTLRDTLAARLTAQALAPLALYTEQGRLDEVFRSLTAEEVTP